MKLMKCDYDREKHMSIVYQGGGLKYEFIADFAKGLPGYLTYTGIAGGTCDIEDNLLLGVRGMPNPVVKLDPEGNYAGEFGGGLIRNCHFLEATKDGTVVIADAAMHVFREIDENGKMIREFGNYGKPGDSGFNLNYYRQQRRLGNLYPPEPYFRIPDLTMLTEAERNTIKKLGTPFCMPTDCAVNSKGEYFFADGYGNVAVHHFDKDCKLVKTWGGMGDEPGKFLMVHAITIDSKDQIWVCDRDQNAVHVFDEEGNVLAYCKGNLGQPSGIVADKDYIYCVGRGGYLTIFTPEFDVVAQIGYFNSELRAHGIACNSKGDLFLFPNTANEDHYCIQLKRL